jgi:hypothetical protein
MAVQVQQLITCHSLHGAWKTGAVSIKGPQLYDNVWNCIMHAWRGHGCNHDISKQLTLCPYWHEHGGLGCEVGECHACSTSTALSCDYLVMKIRDMLHHIIWFWLKTYRDFRNWNHTSNLRAGETDDGRGHAELLAMILRLQRPTSTMCQPDYYFGLISSTWCCVRPSNCHKSLECGNRLIFQPQYKYSVSKFEHPVSSKLHLGLDLLNHGPEVWDSKHPEQHQWPQLLSFLLRCVF